jgi:hypothetical protein
VGREGPKGDSYGDRRGPRGIIGEPGMKGEHGDTGIPGQRVRLLLMIKFCVVFPTAHALGLLSSSKPKSSLNLSKGVLLELLLFQGSKGRIGPEGPAGIRVSNTTYCMAK